MPPRAHSVAAPLSPDIAWQSLCDHKDHPPSQAGPAYASDAPIRPSQCKVNAQRDFLVGAAESDRVPASEEVPNLPGAAESARVPAAEEVSKLPGDIHEEDEEVEEGRVPKSRKFPDSMNPEELRSSALPHSRPLPSGV